MPRPRKPTKIHELNGWPSHSSGEKRKKQNEPQPDLDFGPRPPYLDDLAASEWDRVIEHVRNLKMFTVLDRSVMEAYCVAYARWREAEELVIKNGGLVIKYKGKWMTNPAFTAAHKCMDQMRRIAAEFGFTPVSRSRLSIDLKPKDADADFFDDDSTKLPKPGEAKRAALEDRRGKA